MYKIILGFVTIIAATAALAAQEQLGDWAFEPAGPNGEWILTSNGSQDGLGKTCPKSVSVCYWEFITQTACTKGSSIPVILSSDMGAMAATLECTGDRDQSTGWTSEYFDDPRDVQSFIEQASMLSVAIPMQNGTFVVARFSMNGAKQALAALDDLESHKPPPSARNAKDETL